MESWALVGPPVALASLAVLIWARARDRVARWLSVALIVDAVHLLAHAAPALTEDAVIGQALVNTLHLPSYFGALAMTLFVTGFTGRHTRFWYGRGGLGLLVGVGMVLTTVELALPSPFYTFGAGAMHLAGPLSSWSSLYGFGHVLLDVYLIGLTAWALADHDDPQRASGHALLLAYLLVRQVSVLVEFSVMPVRWEWLGLIGAAQPALLPDERLVRGLLAVLFTAAPLVLLWRAPHRPLRQTAGYAVATALGVNLLLAVGLEAGSPFQSARALFGGLLLVYAAIRHGLVDLGGVRSWQREASLGALGFGVLLVLSTSTLGGWVPELVALTGGLATAVLLTTLTLCTSGSPFFAMDRTPPTPPLYGQLGHRGDVIAGRYRLRETLHVGPRGETHLARDRRQGRDVVVKLLPHGPHERALAAREVRALGSISSPHVVPLEDVIETRQGICLVAPYQAGGCLKQRLASGPLDDEAFLRLARGLLGALGAAHDADIVHRDVKPGNVLYDADGRPRLGDFGIARIPDLDVTLTTEQADPGTLGTPRYMSPEQARGQPAGPASDLHGAGLTLYEAHMGRPYIRTHPAESRVRLCARIAAAPPFQPPTGMRPELADWFARALAPEPAERFPSAGAMLEALEAALVARPLVAAPTIRGRTVDQR